MSDPDEHPCRRHRRKLHKNWRLWLAVGLMLLCMLIYLLTLDESIGPNTQPVGNPPPINTAPGQR